MRRQSLLSRLAAAFIGLLALAVVAMAQTAEVYIPDTDADADTDDDVLTLDSGAPTGNLPVLFVHGHNSQGDESTNPSHERNWKERSRGRSFAETLEANDGLGIEPYYIHFVNQGHSISNDAADIRDAVDLILHRHDQNYSYPYVTGQTTTVQVVIIAYSKGTISTRLYLKNLEAEGRSFRPISEFIAISPPNHGINIALGTNCAGQQLMNGERADCGSFFTNPCGSEGSANFITNLNQPNEAPGSRAAGPVTAPNPPSAGTLYVTIFASGDRDFVGGDSASSDCGGRRRARNLSPNAVNIEVAEITNEGWETLHNFLYPTISDETIGFTEIEKQAVAIHQNTVHTPEVICQALYVALHHRAPPQNLICTPDSDGIPIIPRAAAMLTLDFSGSMALPTGPNATRASVLKEAAELFIRLWSAVSVPSDRIGANYFRTNVEQFPTTGPALQPLSVGGEPLIINLRDVQEPRDNTAMGNGLQRAIEQLRDTAADAKIRRVILFTDGMQNVNPMARIVDNQLRFVNESGRPNSNVSPTAPSALDPLLGIAVDTIGIGASDVGLLEDIADRTGGRSRATTDTEMLRQFFVEELITALKGFSPQLVAYRRGSINSAGNGRETFAVEGGPRRVVLKVSWKRGDSMDFSVAKDGVDVTSAGRVIKGAFYKIFVIDLPKKGKNPIAVRGNWQLRIKGKATTAYETAAIVDGGRITYDAVFNAKRSKAGDPLDLVVRSTAGGKPLDASAKVTATLMIPTTTARDLIATKPPKEPRVFEPGMTLAERQLLALTQDPKEWAKLRPRRQTVVLKRGRNGAFSTQLRPQVPGIYTAVVTIDGEAAKIGKFSRTMTATTVVRTREPSTPPDVK